MAKKHGPAIYDLNSVIAAGIDPKTKLPLKAVAACGHKAAIKQQLNILDEQDAINRFTWFNLPKGLNGRLMERILYYRGQAMFFKLDDRFYFLPYALNGTIDVYGRYTEVTPLPFNGKSTVDDKEQTPWITGLTRKCIYEAQLPDEYVDGEEILVDKILSVQDESCVLIKDFSEQISQINIARWVLQDPVIDLMAEMFPFMHTALLNATGVQGMRVSSQDEQSNVESASKSVNRAALEGRKYIPIVGSLDFQDLTAGNVAKAEEFLVAMQSLDNYRLSLHGLDNGGLFQKKSHMLEAEQKMNTGTTGLILRDSLQYRQDACTIINSIWGLDMWCEPSEVVTAMDTNGDGIAGSNEDMGTNGQSAEGEVYNDDSDF